MAKTLWEKHRALFHVLSLGVTLLGIFAAAAVAMSDVKRHEISINRLESGQAVFEEKQVTFEKRLIRVDNNIEILMRHQNIKPLPPVE